MKKHFLYYTIFGISFFLFGLVQSYIRPSYVGGNDLVIYFLGVAPNFFPGIGIPSFFYVSIPEVFKSNSSFYKNRLKWSVVISMIGLIGNEFIAKYTPGRGVFDWNDILWTLIGGSLFILVNKLVEKE